MQDIELRFLERIEEMQASGEVPMGRRVRVLQWRKRYATYGTALALGWVWTDWQDVPMVQEGE